MGDPCYGENCQARAKFYFFFSFFNLKAVFVFFSVFLFFSKFGSPPLAVLRAQ